MANLPKWLFVTRMKNNDGSTWLQASESQVEAVEQDEAETPIVGTYQLVARKKLRLVKTVEFVGKKLR